jgi:uncharacterized protein (DUF849 family)
LIRVIASASSVADYLPVTSDEIERDARSLLKAGTVVQHIFEERIQHTRGLLVFDVSWLVK